MIHEYVRITVLISCYVLLFFTKSFASEIILSFVGDCTLGENYLTYDFTSYYNEYGPDYFFAGVKSVFEDDDLTIANCEGTFTESETRVVKTEEKTFWFKGKPEYADIFKRGSVEIVNLANNHILDYGVQGYSDTQKALKQYGVDYYGNDEVFVKNVNGINIGFYGLYLGNITIDAVNERIQRLIDKEADVIVGAFHTGTESQYFPTDFQKSIARKAIDLGTDIVIQHHPHVLQDVAWYNNKIIAYSLGNFCFGGNTNPGDKRSMIFQVKVDKYLNLAFKKIPVLISGRSDRNDYRPVLESRWIYPASGDGRGFRSGSDSTPYRSWRRSNAKNKGGITPLILAAAYNSNPEVITVLVQTGANVNARDESGLTPLMWAAANNSNPEVITALLNLGSDPKAKDDSGQTAIDYVRKNEKLRGTDALSELEEASRP